MNYTEKETKDWKARLNRRGIAYRLPKRRPDQLPSYITVTDALTGEIKQVKPVYKKAQTKRKKTKAFKNKKKLK